jgi:hypothetical protein
MSYGEQLNVVRAQADLYGAEWRVLVLARNASQLRGAAEDAKNFLGGNMNAASRRLTMHNGCTVRFAVCRDVDETRLLAGLEFTHVIWLYTPERESGCHQYTRALLRSRVVPATSFRHEYVRL